MYLACKSCGEETVSVISPSFHVSHYVTIGLNGYEADNDDDSWKSTNEPSFFRCDECNYSWPCDGPVSYNWVGD